MKILKKQKAGIALIVVVVLSAFAVLGGITTLQTMVDFANVTKSYRSRQKTYMYTISCIEESLYKLSLNRTYLGSMDFVQDDYSCKTEVVEDPENENYRILNIEGVYDEYTYTDSKKVDISGSKLELIQH